jgi:hypothetical protein
MGIKLSDIAIDEQVAIAKALRNSFCETQRTLLKGSYMSDEAVIDNVREMQEQYKIFERYCEEIKLIDEKLYDKEILGLDQ